MNEISYIQWNDHLPLIIIILIFVLYFLLEHFIHINFKKQYFNKFSHKNQAKNMESILLCIAQTTRMNSKWIQNESSEWMRTFFRKLSDFTPNAVHNVQSHIICRSCRAKCKWVVANKEFLSIECSNGTLHWSFVDMLFINYRHAVANFTMHVIRYLACTIHQFGKIFFCSNSNDSDQH